MNAEYRVARVSNCQMRTTKDGAEAEKNYQINRVMKEMFHVGHRRFRVIPAKPTGDGMAFIVFGWRP